MIMGYALGIRESAQRPGPAAAWGAPQGQLWLLQEGQVLFPWRVAYWSPSCHGEDLIKVYISSSGNNNNHRSQKPAAAVGEQLTLQHTQVCSALPMDRHSKQITQEA